MKDASDIRTQIEALQAKSKKRGIKFNDVNVVESETQCIQLPEGMSPGEGVKWLQRFEQQQNQEVGIHIEIDAFPLDGAYALARVLKNIFGWTTLESTPGFWGDTPPTMVNLEIGPDESVMIPWGRMAIPGIDGFISTSMGRRGLRPTFIIAGKTTRKHEKLIQNIGDQVKLEILDGSVYRGKAIILDYRDADGDRIEPDNVDPTQCPKFVDTRRVNSEELVFPAETMQMIETCLFNPVKHTAACRHHGIPLKRGVLLEGPYGTGKTQTAYLLAKECVANGWTFLYGKDVRDLDILLSIAEAYQPCVIFAEDVNRIVGENRDAEVDRVLNAMDGVVSKKSEIMVVLTTNELNAIHQAAIRPGRIDTVVPVRAPDIDAACRLVKLYGRGKVDCTDQGLASAIQPLVDRKSTAAMFREVVERAKLGAVGHLTNATAEIKISAEDLRIAAETLVEHQKLLEPRAEPNTHPMGIFGGALGKALSIGVAEAIEDAADTLYGNLEDEGQTHAAARRIAADVGR
jgi:transitional endoplasmic reticulum ATPase